MWQLAIETNTWRRASVAAVLVKIVAALSLLLVPMSYGSALELIQSQAFPKLMGINIGAKNYDDLKYQRQIARLDAVILGFHRGWRGDRFGEKIRETVLALKALNPNLLIGQYTVLNEAYSEGNPAKADIVSKISQNNWWARSAHGDKVQWTRKYGTWEVNNTMGAKADSNGDRYPEWLARREDEQFFSRVPFDIWYFDNVMWKPRISLVDWNGDGINEKNSDPLVQKAYRLGNQREWAAARKLQPDLIFVGNADNDLGYPEYNNQLQGALLECLIGRSWSIENRQGWDTMMERYRRAIRNTASPRMVVFHACGDPKDKRFFRYAFASSLLDDGWFSFTDNEKGYSSVPWFKEYDIDLGRPIEKPVFEKDVSGLYSRKFEYGMVFVNTNRFSEIEIEIAPGYVPISTERELELMPSVRIKNISIPSRDGLILRREVLVVGTGSE